MRPVAIYTIPPMPPYMCMKCRNSDQVREMFIDLGFETDYEGVVYLCNICLTNIGKEANIFMTYQQHQDAMELVEARVGGLLVLEQNIEKWTDSFYKLTGTDLVTFFDNLEAVQNVDDRRELFYGTTDGNRSVDRVSEQFDGSSEESSSEHQHVDADELSFTNSTVPALNFTGVSNDGIQFG